jgi:hypothetical protein
VAVKTDADVSLLPDILRNLMVKLLPSTTSFPGCVHGHGCVHAPGREHENLA